MKLSKIAKNVVITICILSALIIAGAVIYFRSLSCLPFVFGVLLGSGAAVSKALILDKTVDTALKKEAKAATNYTLLSQTLRMLLTGGVLILAALVPGIEIWGTAAGVLTFQAAIYLQRFIFKEGDNT